MVTELRVHNQSQSLYVRALSQAWRNNIQVYDPSLWLLRDAEAEEKMLRDADIAHAIDYRRYLIAGRQWSLLPRLEAAPESELAVAVGTQLLEGIRNFTGARFNLARAFFSGARFAQVHGSYRTMPIGDGRDRTWWVPYRLEDLDKRMFRVVPKNDGKRIDAHWERWNVAKEKFLPQSQLDATFTVRHVYQDDQASLGYGRGLREAIGWWWYAKSQVFEESLQAVERFAQGLFVAKVDGIRDAATGKPNTQLVADWMEALQNMRARHVMVLDSADNVEVIPGGGEGWQMLKDMREELRSALFTLILGANLPTAAGKGGSYALGDVQQDSTEAIVQFDRDMLDETLSDELLGCVWYANHANLVELGIADQKPRYSTKQEKLEDPVKRSQVAQTLNSMGVELSLEDVLDQTGFRKPTDGEDVVEGRQAPEMPFGGGPPGGGGDEGDQGDRERVGKGADKAEELRRRLRRRA